MKSSKRPSARQAAGLSITLAVATTAMVYTVHYRAQKRTSPGPKMVYTSQGYGGMTPAAAQPDKSAEADPVARMSTAYDGGQYARAQSLARQWVSDHGAETGPTQVKQRLQVQLMGAYAAARRKDMRTASDGFIAVRDAAEALPDHGAPIPVIGQSLPTLEEEAAFQHAVCTGVLEGHASAEQEFSYFMERYPQSILIHAAVKRIGRFHHGNVPKAAELVWRNAMKLQHVHELAVRREGSMCGPQCLAELLRRRGEHADVHGLANEMSTSAEGTSLADLATAARKRGFAPVGLALTQNGLAKQALPMIALLMPGHFVIVDAVAPAKVTVWDPAVTGLDRKHDYDLKTWTGAWTGTALAVR